MTAAPKPTTKPKGWSAQDDAAFQKAIKKALPLSTVLDDLARSNDPVPSPLREDHRGANPLHRSSHTRQKKV